MKSISIEQSPQRSAPEARPEKTAETGGEAEGLQRELSQLRTENDRLQAQVTELEARLGASTVQTDETQPGPAQAEQPRLISEDAPPEAKRAFFIDGQRQEQERRQRHFEATNAQFGLLIDSSRTLVSNDPAARSAFDGSVRAAKARFAEAAVAHAKSRMTYEKRIAAIQQLTPEQIADVSENNPVRKVMDESYGETYSADDAFLKASHEAFMLVPLNVSRVEASRASAATPEQTPYQKHVEQFSVTMPSPAGEVVVTQEGLRGDAPPAVAREFFINGQKHELNKFLLRSDRAIDQLRRSAEVARSAAQARGVETATADAAVQNVLQLIQAAEALRQRISAIYEQRMRKLSALTDEEISDEDAQGNLTRVGEIMDKSYPESSRLQREHDDLFDEGAVALTALIMTSERPTI